MKPKKIGKLLTIDMDTGEVVAEKQNAMMLLPPGDNVCQICAVDHEHDQPHNQQSLFYQYHFYSTHGRWPTWSDALAHCTPEMQREWKTKLIALMKEKGIDVPLDLLEVGPATGR